MEQTKLQKIVEQKTDQIRRAIEQAIDEGAKIENRFSNFATIDAVLLQKDNRYAEGVAIVLTFESKKIAKFFRPSKEALAELADRKRKELAEIEQQLNERANE